MSLKISFPLQVNCPAPRLRRYRTMMTILDFTFPKNFLYAGRQCIYIGIGTFGLRVAAPRPAGVGGQRSDSSPSCLLLPAGQSVNAAHCLRLIWRWQPITVRPSVILNVQLLPPFLLSCQNVMQFTPVSFKPLFSLLAKTSKAPQGVLVSLCNG